MAKIDRVIRAVYSQPWAILPEKLDAIVEFLEMRAAGKLSAEEIEARIGDRKTRTRGDKSTAVLPVFGVLGRRMGSMEEISGGTSTERLQGMLDQALESKSVSRIVLHVDSPGGQVQGTPELAARIKEARSEKPVIGIIDGLGASAAYWLSSASSKLFATPSALVGSIGVIAQHVDTTEAEAEAGIHRTVIYEPRFKGEGEEPITDEAHAHLKGLVDHFYGMFVKAVADQRNVSQTAVRGEAWGEGRVVNADRALEAGMIDGIATVEDVVAGNIDRRGMRASRHQTLAALADLDRRETIR